LVWSVFWVDVLDVDTFVGFGWLCWICWLCWLCWFCSCGRFLSGWPFPPVPWNKYIFPSFRNIHSLPLTHSLTHSLTNSLTHSPHSLTQSFTPSLTPSLTHSLSLPHSLTLSLTFVWFAVASHAPTIQVSIVSVVHLLLHSEARFEQGLVRLLIMLKTDRWCWWWCWVGLLIMLIMLIMSWLC
jgi:hypothetical protein